MHFGLLFFSTFALEAQTFGSTGRVAEMSNELGVEQYCEQHLQDNTCMAIKAAIGASLELKKRGVKPRFANFALTRWGKYPSWTKGSVTVTEPDAPNKPAVAQVHDAAGVVGYGVCNILRTILTHSVNQYGTGTCGSVAPLAALSWSAPAQAIKMSLRLFWVGTMHKSFKVCDNIYDLQPGLVPLSNDKVDVAVGRKMKHMQPTKIEHLCQEKCDQLEAVKEGKSFPMMSAGLTAMWTYASLSHLKEAPKGCPAPTDSVLQVMYPDMIQEEPTKMEAFFDKEPTSMQWYLGPDGRKMLYHDDPAHDDNLNLCKQFISPNCVRVKDVPVVDYQENEDQLNKACAALKAGGASILSVAGSTGLSYGSKEKSKPGLLIDGQLITDQGKGTHSSHQVYLQDCDVANNVYTIWSWAGVLYLTKQNLIGTPEANSERVLWQVYLAETIYIFDD